MSEVGSGPVYVMWCIFACVCAGAAFVYWLRPGMSWTINHPVFEATMLKLIRGGDLDRPLKICHAIPKTLISQALRGTLSLALKRGKPSDPQKLTEELARSLHADADVAIKQLRRWNALVLPAVLVAFVVWLGLGTQPRRVWWMGDFSLELQWPFLVVAAALYGVISGARTSWTLRRFLLNAPITYVPPLVEAITGQHIANFEVERVLNPHPSQERDTPDRAGQSPSQIREGFRLHPAREPGLDPIAAPPAARQSWPLRRATRSGWLAGLGRRDGVATLQGYTLTLSMDGGVERTLDLSRAQVAHLHVWPEAGRRRWLELSLTLGAERLAFQSQLPAARVPEHAARLKSSAPIAPKAMLVAIWGLLRDLESQRGQDPPPAI